MFEREFANGGVSIDGDDFIDIAGSGIVLVSDKEEISPGDEVTVITDLITLEATYLGTDGNGGAIFEGEADIPFVGTIEGKGWVSDTADIRQGTDKEDGSEIPEVVEDDLVVCLTEGTMVATPAGERAVEDLEVGDEILTWDGRTETVRFIASNKISEARVRLSRSLAPVRIRAGALGDGCPHTDLVVSQQHKILITGARAVMLFDAPEVLVTAVSLVNDSTITLEPVAPVTYYVIACDKHEVISANGAPADTLYLAPDAVRDPAQRAEVEAVFPGLLDAPRGAYGAPAARILSEDESRGLTVFARG